MGQIFETEQLVLAIETYFVYCKMEDWLDDDVFCDLDVFQAHLKFLNREKWWIEAAEKPKLRTFIEKQDRGLRQAVVKKNMSRSQRSVVSKFKCGVLPLMIEVGRFRHTAGR